MLSKTKSLTSNFLWYAINLEHDTTRLNNCYPLFWITLTGTHTSLCRLLSDWLIWEDSNPHLTATLHLTGESNTSSLNLAVSNPVSLLCTDTPGTKMQLGITLCLALHGTALYLTVQYTLWSKH